VKQKQLVCPASSFGWNQGAAMAINRDNLGLYTDLYELTMAQGYYLTGKAETEATFDYFYRKNPFEGGYVIFAGLQDFLDSIPSFRFDHDSCQYLASLGFRKEFIDYLSSFSFQGEILAFREGEIVFPYEPVMIIKGNILESQLIETLLLNIINFQSLIATKASRIRDVAGDRAVMDFGLRRAQSWGGLHASRASVIGGCDSTSNVFAARLYDIPPSGTQAHSWIQSFESELKAFRKYTEIYPDNSILLVDTYNTLSSGVPNAVKVAREMEARGARLKGIRLDSGDLAYLSKRSREMLDKAGLTYVKIFASNQLDEYVIRSLNQQNAPIDGFGVGTSLITGRDDAALDGVYKLSMSDGKPRLKLSENITKIIIPGEKAVFRYFNGDGSFYADAICLDSEKRVDMIYHPHEQETSCSLKDKQFEPLLKPVMRKGKQVRAKIPVRKIAEYHSEQFDKLQEEYKRFENPHIYKVGLSDKLLKLRNKLIRATEKKEKD